MCVCRGWRSTQGSFLKKLSTFWRFVCLFLETGALTEPGDHQVGTVGWPVILRGPSDPALLPPPPVLERQVHAACLGVAAWVLGLKLRL